MKISFNWLKEYIEINKTVEEVSDLLTLSGLEVEGIEKIESIPGGLHGLVVAEVLTCAQHPNADKLKVTTVDVGTGETLQVVCGAPNVAQGQKVILATVGTTLYTPDGDSFKIKKSKIRGELSQGMICAEDEIGLGGTHDGIIVLETEYTNGTPAREVFEIEDDYVIEIGLTPNRVDAASHYGVVRDLAVLLNKKGVLPSVKDFTVDNNDLPIGIVIEKPEACPRYSGVSISGITVESSPEWLQNKLKAIGLEPINNVVDITNFVLHETGQPLHAFDADQIANKEIIVTTLAEGTPFITLDEKERKVLNTDLMICDGNKSPMCIAGVFGGINSGSTEKTTNVFLESAYFSPNWVRKSSLKHGLKTDAAFRFERGVDPNGTLYALKRAALLIKEIAGGKISSEITDIYPEPVKPFEVSLSIKNVDRLLGISIPSEQIESILSGLEIEVQKDSDDLWQLQVPAYRVDVQREADVIEEIARLYGYDKIEMDVSLSTQFMSPLPANDGHRIMNSIADYLTSNGFNEMVTNSLTKSSNVQLEDYLKEENTVPIFNFLSEDLNALRQSMLISGLEIIAYNANRKQTNLKFFEIGKTYHQFEEKYTEKQHLSLFLSGNNHAESWIKKAEKVDFYDLVPIIKNLFSLVGIKDISSEYTHNNALSGITLLDSKGNKIATIGIISPRLLDKVGVKQTTLFADIDLYFLLKKKPAEIDHIPISKYPEVKRDLSLVLDKTVSFEQVLACAKKTERKLVKRINVFDVYEGENIGADKKAYALSFILHDQDKNLNDKIIDKSMNRLIQSFEKELGAVIRK